jgi:hypothetical protein
MGYPVIQPLEDFTALCPRVTETGASSLELTPELAGIFVLTV